MPFALQRTCVFAGLLAAAMLALGGCSDDSGAIPQALGGSAPGLERYVVHLAGEPPDASAYNSSLLEDPDKVPALVAELRAEAELSRKRFVQALNSYDGRVVDHWWLTNAVTVELPAGNAASLRAIDGVVKVEPDQFLVE
jgi:hypothetical protein